MALAADALRRPPTSPVLTSGREFVVVVGIVPLDSLAVGPSPTRRSTMAKGQQQPKNVKKPKLTIKEKQDKKAAKNAKKGL